MLGTFWTQELWGSNLDQRLIALIATPAGALSDIPCGPLYHVNVRYAAIMDLALSLVCWKVFQVVLVSQVCIGPQKPLPTYRNNMDILSSFPPIIVAI